LRGVVVPELSCFYDTVTGWPVGGFDMKTMKINKAVHLSVLKSWDCEYSNWSAARFIIQQWAVYMDPYRAMER